MKPVTGALLLVTLAASGVLAQGPTRPILARQEGTSRPGGFERLRLLPPGQREGRRLLYRMIRADQKVSYFAREVLTGRAHTMEMWVKYDPKRGVRRESIQPPGELIVDNTERAWHFSSKQNRYVERDSMLARLQGRWKEMLANLGDTLKVERQGEDTIAGRIADIVLVAPPEGTAGQSRRFWIDRESGLRLRMEERDAAGRIVVSSYFLTVELNPTFKDADFAAPTPPPGVRVVKEKRRTFATFDEAARAGFPVRVPGFLPMGYAAQSVDVSPDGRWVTAHWGNGISVISLTQVRAPFPPPLDKAEPGFRDMPGKRRGYGWRDGDSLFFLMGSLPDETVKRIADSVK